MCSGCGLVFTGDEAQAGEPVVHQKWELPPISPLIFEYRLHRVCCPGCAKKTLAGLPAGVSASAFGPRLEAHIAMLAGVYRLSRRQVAQVVEEILGCPISTGAVDTAIMRMSRVLADPWQALAEAIRQADVVHADETSWRLAGAQQWLWLGAAALVACYRIDPHRSQAAAKKLLGEDFGGFSSQTVMPAITSWTCCNSNFAGVTQFVSSSRSPSARALPASSAQSS